MGIDIVRYHGWKGKLHSPWFGCLSMVRVALMQLFRRKLYWGVYALGLLHFLMLWFAVYAGTQLRDLPKPFQGRFLNAIGVNDGQDLYVNFMRNQNLAVMMLLAFSGSMLVGEDFRAKTIPFYLSRRLDRVHYIFGKLLSISSVIILMTVVPALLLFLEYGMFTSSWEFWFTNWNYAVTILFYGGVMCMVLSILLATVSAYLKRMAPIAITWAGIFILLSAISRLMKDVTENRYWELLNLWSNIGKVGLMPSRVGGDEIDRRLEWLALAVLTVICSAAMAALVRRVHSIDVVH